MTICTANSLLEGPLNAFLTEKNYKNKAEIFSQNSLQEGCYFVLQGNVYGVVRDEELNRTGQLKQTFSAGSVMGVLEMLANSQHRFTAIADGEVKCAFLSKKQFEKMQKNSEITLGFYKLIADSMLMHSNGSQQSMIDDALVNSSIPEVDFMVNNAVQAQRELQHISEQKIDQIIQEIAQKINENALSLAQQTVHESGMGIVDHKVLKIGLGTIDVAASLVGQPGVGVLQNSGDGVQTILTPMGVIFGMIPITNPVETIAFKCLSALKSRNAIIVSSHSKGKEVGFKTVQLIQSVLQAHNLPVGLVQAPMLPANRAVTNAFMRHDNINFILATGGPSMVKSAYQSGTPAIGVGKGNAPVWICKDANIEQAAQHVISSKSFDNGIVCGSENNILLDSEIETLFFEQAINNGAAVFTDAEVASLLEHVFSSGRLDPHWVGQSAAQICEFLNIKRDYPIRLILAKVNDAGMDSPLLKEKLAPVLSVSIMHSQAQALKMAKEILKEEGAGHTAIIHGQDPVMIEQYAHAVDVSRILVNTPGTQGCIGAANGLSLSWTLGCGTQGGGSTSDNVTYRHLMNSKRLANAH